MMSKNAKRIQNSLGHVKKISGTAFKALRVFLVVYLILTIPVFCYSLIVIFTAGLSLQDLLWMGLQVVPMVLSIVVTVSVCMALLRLFGDVNKGESPFTDSQSNRFKLIGWLLLASFVLGAMISVAPMPYTQIGSLTFGIFSPTPSPSGIDFDLSYILWAVVSFSFSQVFKYGTLLQQLSDDTV